MSYNPLNRLLSFIKRMKSEYPNIQFKGSIRWEEDRSGEIETEFYHNHLHHSFTTPIRGTGERVVEQAMEIAERKMKKYFFDYNKKQAERARFKALPQEEQNREIQKSIDRALKFFDYLDSIREGDKVEQEWPEEQVAYDSAEPTKPDDNEPILDESVFKDEEMY